MRLASAAVARAVRRQVWLKIKRLILSRLSSFEIELAGILRLSLGTLVIAMKNLLLVALLLTLGSGSIFSQDRPDRRPGSAEKEKESGRVERPVAPPADPPQPRAQAPRGDRPEAGKERPRARGQQNPPDQRAVPPRSAAPPEPSPRREPPAPRQKGEAGEGPAGPANSPAAMQRRNPAPEPASRAKGEGRGEAKGKGEGEGEAKGEGKGENRGKARPEANKGKAAPKGPAAGRPPAGRGTAERPAAGQPDAPKRTMPPEPKSRPGEATDRPPSDRPAPGRNAARRAEPNPDPKVRAAVEEARAERQRARSRADAQTQRVLKDRAANRDRDRERDLARHVEDDDDAKTLILSVLGGAAAGAVAGHLVSGGRDRSHHRLPPTMVGRDPRDRVESVDFLSRRFRGDAPWSEAPPSWRYHDHWRDDRHPHYFPGDRRVVYYRSYENIPPILVASHQLNYVEVDTVGETRYVVDESAPNYDRNLPEAFRRDDAYAVSYQVDPESAVILEDILFQQGSTDFADAYSYDLVADLAEAMNAPEVAEERFVVEGHASAEGDYQNNLQLSQFRAERISRDLVAMGVAPERLVPVGYGESEARFPENADEAERGLDRRVMVFRLKN